jgi:hypothetical protein
VTAAGKRAGVQKRRDAARTGPYNHKRNENANGYDMAIILYVPVSLPCWADIEDLCAFEIAIAGYWSTSPLEIALAFEPCWRLVCHSFFNCQPRS